jgi:hypothetical protein
VVPTEKGRRGIEAAAKRIAEIKAHLTRQMGKERLEGLTASLTELAAILGGSEGLRTGPAHQNP